MKNISVVDGITLINMADNKKVKSLVTVNWTSLDNTSEPFYQAASGSHPDRYSVTVVSKHETTGGPHLQNRMNQAKEPGLSRILKYYSKVGNDKLHEDVITEDYYVSSRPKAKMKILISLPCSTLDGLGTQTKQKNLDSLGPVTSQIDLNTYDLSEKVESAVSLINKYSAEINQFYGRVYGIDFTEETTSLQGFIPALSTFMADNNINYSRSNSDLISLYINDDYKVLMSKVNQGSGYVDLIKGYENFVENDSVNNDRTIFFLSKLDEMQKLAIQNTPLSWSKFLKEYVYRTPEIDFSQPPPRSYWTKKPVHDRIMKEERAKVQTKEEVTNFRFFLNTPEVRQEIQAQLDVANSFVGDTVLANLNSLSSKTREIEAMYNEFFDKLGLNGLINSAIQCLDLPRIGVFDVPTDVLDTLTEATKTIQSIFDPPNISLPSDYPIADFMLDLFANIIETIVTTIVQALWQLLIEIIKSLFDFCNDCAGAGGSEVNFGGQGITDLIGKSIGANLAASGPSIVLGSFYSAVQDNAIGDAELLAQTVLKNSVKSREKIYTLEAAQVFQKYQSGEMSKPNRLALEKKVEEAALSGNYFIAEAQKVVPTRVTEERIKILLEKDEPWERTEVFKSASDEITEYLETVSTVLTPSEVGNALLGCNLGDEPKQVMRDVLPQFPNLQLVLSGMSPKETDDNVSRFMGGFSSILPEKSIVDNLAATLNTIPEKFDCLCDADDSALREQILSKKDPEMTPQQVKEQVAKSKQRKKQRITEFAKMLNNDNILDGVVPPLVCSGTYDENGNAIITRGVLPVSHPVTQLMINQTIDTIYDPLHTTFSRDLQGMIPAFSQRPLLHEEVDRTVEIEVDGEEIRILNPSFVDMVNKGMASWGSLPNGSAIPGSKKPKDDGFDPADPDEEYTKGTEVKEYNRFIGFFDSDYLNPYGAGMWDEGQSRPTPEQEYEWERVNKLYNTGGRTISSTNESAQVTLENGGVQSTRTVEFGEKYNSAGNTVPATISDYAKAFGESPIPVKDYKFGELDYAPGLKNSYVNMCRNLNTSNSTVSTDIFKIQPKPDHTKTDYSFKMPNLFKSYGVDFDKIADNVGKLSGELSLGGVNRTINGDSLGQVANQLKALAASELNFVYSPNNNDGTSNLQKDEFSLDLNILSTPANNSSGSAQKLDSAINFSGPPTAAQINTKAVKVIESKELASIRKPADTSKPVQPQEGYFYDFAKDAMINANTVYRNGQPIQRQRNESVPPSLQDGFLHSTEENTYVNFLYDEETYKNIFVDLFCAFTNQISESPYFNLKPDDLGRGLKNVNLTPTRIVGNDALCYRTLLDVDLIKDRIFDEYEYVKCFKDAFGLNNVDFDPTGLIGNRNSAFEISNRAGCILLTIRLYVVEYLLRSISTFHYFTLGNKTDIDATSVYYLYHQIVDGLISRSVGTEYYRAFQTETIELYNRNNQTSKLSLEYEVRDHPQVPEYKLYVYKDFRTALEYFIKNQMASVSRRLSKHVKLKGDGSPHSILIEKWLPTVEPPQEEGEIRFADPVTLENKTLGNYMEVADIQELSGDILAALGPNGTLTKKKIEFIRGTPSPTGGFSGMLYEYPTGYFFREYFGLNPTNDKSLQTPALEGKNYKEARSAMDRANNALWPSNVWSNIGWVKTGNPSFRPIQAWREAINLGYDRSPYYSRSDEMDEVNNNNRMGNMGKAGFPYDFAANVSPAKTITPGKTVKQGAFPFGVSQAEKEGMVGNDGGLLRFFEAAKNWTLGPIPSANRPRYNDPQDQGNEVRALGIESEEGTLRTKNPEYCLWRPNNLPWWWDQDYHQPSSVTSEANRAAFLQSARYYGPGSLLWAMSKEREASYSIFGNGRDQGGRSNGVGAFGMVNDLQTRGTDLAGSVDWPEEYKRNIPTIDGRIIPGQTYKTNSFNGYLIPFMVDWHNYVLGKAGTPGISPEQPDYTECGTCGWTRNTESALRRLELNEIPYISLMDLDVTAITRTLEWEKKQYEDFIADINLILTKAGYALSGTGPQQYGNPTVAEKIDALLNNVDSSELSSFCLKVLKNAYDSLVAANGPPERIRKIQTALEAFAKQDFVANKELYGEIIEKYETDWIPEMREIKKSFELAEEQRNCMVEPAKAIAANGREKRNDMLVPPTLDVSNGNIILEPYIRVEDYGRTENFELIPNKEYIEIDRDDSTRGVVNIDKFDKFMKEKFEGKLNTLPVIKPATSVEEQQNLFQEDCGTGLPSRTEATPENTTQSQKHQLRDYFKNLHFGLRVSLLSKPEDFSDPLKRPEDFVDGGDRTNAKLEKTYYMKEQKGAQERNIYLTPLTSVEIPIGMLTDIESLFPEGGFSIVSPEKLAEQVCGQASPTEQEQVQKVGYFRYLFSQPKQRDGEVVPLSSPQNVLQRQMQETDDYALLFKYIFSLDRMLSLTNLYSASYLSTLPDINNLFAPSKESVMYIFLNSLRSGKWADACQTGNKDLLDALLNGITPPWAALLNLTLKFPLKIFKAYIEQTDINIAISQNIKKAIQMMNSIIATSQRQLNALNQAGAAAIAQGESLLGTEISTTECGFGIHSPESTRKPPNDWFNPVRETFIYEPETWMIGLALLPATIFAPWLWGPPVGTTPGGFPGVLYWVLDDSNINWLDSYVDDFTKQLANNPDPDYNEQIDEPCDVDYQLEFGIGDDMANNNNNGSGNDGGSTY